MKFYNYTKIRNDINELVKKACYSKNNEFKSTAWAFHILPVIKHCLELGKKLNADLEILELAALLHDYAGIKDIKQYENHHVEGAKLAEKILSKYNFPQEKINKIKECILCHRGSVRVKSKLLEAKILASADAMSHISEPVDMFFLTFGIHQFLTPEGAKWLKGKIKRSWNKIMPEGRKMIKMDYNLFMKILDNTLNKKNE